MIIISELQNPKAQETPKVWLFRKSKRKDEDYNNIGQLSDPGEKTPNKILSYPFDYVSFF